MKIRIKLKGNLPNNDNIKYILILVAIIGCVILGTRTYINVVLIGDEANDNTISINNSETTVVTLSTDETTVISDS